MMNLKESKDIGGPDEARKVAYKFYKYISVSTVMNVLHSRLLLSTALCPQ